MPQLLAAAIFAIASFVRRTLATVPRAQGKAWEEAAAAAGLTRIERTARSISGRKGGLDVQLTRFDRRDEQGTLVRISGPALAPTLTLLPEGADSARRRNRGWHEIEVGDAAFDGAVWVEGPPLLLRAILDAETRRIVLSLFEGRLARPRLSPFCASGRLEQGVLRIELPEARVEQRGTNVLSDDTLVFAGGAHFTDGLRTTLELAERLGPPRDPGRRIADNLEREPLPRVRVRCLTALLRELPDHPATRKALLAARQDPDAEVRLCAARALGAEGREVLLGLALGEGADDSTTAQAVAALGERLAFDSWAAILRNALRTRREETAHAVMGVLAARGDSAAIEMIARVLAVEQGPLASAAASTLGLAGTPLAEAPLLAALGRADASLRVAATRALGKVGTVAAVAPLRELEGRDPALRVEARQAIALIQARLAGAAPGQLSLAGGAAGQLSFAEGGAGQLSLAEGQRTPERK